jgi:hypothetical protein
MKSAKRTAKILCANRVGDSVVRYAIQVNQGRTVESVVIVDVERSPDGWKSARGNAALEGVAMDRALWTGGSHKGTRIVGAAFNQESFTGLEQHAEATQPVGGAR